MPETSESQRSVSHARTDAAKDRGSVPIIVVAVIAVAALALAGWALLRPAGGGSDAAGEYTDAQRAEAKTAVCTAFNTVRSGVSLNTNLQAPGGPGDVAGSLAVAANARLSLYDGGQYLLARLAPATAPELADAVRTFGNLLMDIGANATAGAVNTEPQQAARLKEADAANRTIEGLCR
ncbi:hypothetical protein BCL50_4712 [Mycolicibacterium litorale]|nr:hypothetical protein BCL50_4712 [Mycolicibacterium litorale]